MVIAAAALSAAAQGTFQPRDADEMEAWKIYNEYKESRRIADPLEKQIKGKFNDSLMGAYGSFGILGVDQSDRSEAVALRNKQQAELERQARLLEAWNKKFYWRYGDLGWFTDKIKDAKTGREMDRIEFALTYFPFNRSAAAKEPAAASGSSFTVAKGKPGDWGQIAVAFGGLADLTSKDSPGWRNNGTDFSAKTAGGPVSVKISVIGLGNVSYFDYDVGVSVKSSDGTTLMAESRKVSKDGGSLSFSTTWTPTAAGTELTVRVTITGGNPEYFTYFVSGRVGLGKGVSPGGPSAAAPPAAPSSAAKGKPETLMSTGNDQGVLNGGKPVVFSLKVPTVITQILTYHWNNGRGAPGGTIKLVNTDGDTFGPWQVTVRSNVYWEVNREITLPAGTYTVFDSDPATWAQNAQSGGKGMVTITGIKP